MSRSKRFFSTIPGLVTGLAGLLTGVVGLVTVLIQLGVLGGDDGRGTTTTTTATAPAVAPPAGGGGGATTTTEVPAFTVEPTTLDFKVGDPREKTVRVRNVSNSASLTLSQPRIIGDDASQFSVSAGACGGLRPGESCMVRVTFAPTGSVRTYRATLQLTGPGARVEEVRLMGSTLLS